MHNKPCKKLMTLEGMPLYIKTYFWTEITQEEQEGGVPGS